MNKLQYFDTELDEDNYVPYMRFQYEDRVALDPEMIASLGIAVGWEQVGLTLAEIILDGFRKELSETLVQELNKRGLKCI